MAVDEGFSVTPTTSVPTSGLDLAKLASGRVVEARVASVVEGIALVASRHGTLSVDLAAFGRQTPAPGDTVRLQVQAIDGGGKPSFTVVEHSAAVTADPAATANARPVEDPVLVLAQAVRGAAANQTGLAPLYATLAGLAAAPAGTVPEQVRTLVAQLMGGRLAAGSPPTAETLRKAFLGSGLFLESRLATTPGGRATPADDLKAALFSLRAALEKWVGASPAGPSGAPASGTAAQARPGTTADPLLRPGDPAGGRPNGIAGGAPAPDLGPRGPVGRLIGAAYGGAMAGGAVPSSPYGAPTIAPRPQAGASAVPGGAVPPPIATAPSAASGGAATVPPAAPTAAAPATGEPPLAAPAVAGSAGPAAGTDPAVAGRLAGAAPAAATLPPAAPPAPGRLAGGAEAEPMPSRGATTPSATATMPPVGANPTIGTGFGPGGMADPTIGNPLASPPLGGTVPTGASGAGAATGSAATDGALSGDDVSAPTPTLPAGATPASAGTATGAAPTTADDGVAQLLRAVVRGLEIAGSLTAPRPTEAGEVAAALAAIGPERELKPPPPRRGQAPRGQAALADERIGADGVEGLGRRALERTEGALSRILLEQFATLDRRTDDPAAPAEARATREWTAELPIATAGGTGVVQMTVERDGGRERGRDASVKPAWRVRFSMDVEPLGPVHAQIGLTGEKLSIGLWAERPDAATRLGGDVGRLQGALEAAAIPVESIHLATGRPTTNAAAPTAGRFVDVKL